MERLRVELSSYSGIISTPASTGRLAFQMHVTTLSSKPNLFISIFITVRFRQFFECLCGSNNSDAKFEKCDCLIGLKRISYNTQFIKVFLKFRHIFIQKIVLGAGLEPARPWSADFKSAVSAIPPTQDTLMFAIDHQPTIIIIIKLVRLYTATIFFNTFAFRRSKHFRFRRTY